MVKPTQVERARRETLHMGDRAGEHCHWLKWKSQLTGGANTVKVE